MDRKIRVVQYGAGKMSRYLMRYVLEHGGELVGAFCRNKNHIGKDVSEIIGDGFPMSESRSKTLPIPTDAWASSSPMCA